MKINELLKESDNREAYDTGFDDARNHRPKKSPLSFSSSFGQYAVNYFKGYDEGKAANDHEDWQEKTAAKRQGQHYHESSDQFGHYDSSTKYGIWASVSGGQTGSRAAWAKKDGERIEVDSYEEATEIAREYMKMAGNRMSGPRFKYQPMELHESKRTEHKGYYGKDGTWFPNEEEYAASLKGDPNEEREESKKKIDESYQYAMQGEEYFTHEEYEAGQAELKASGGIGMFPSAEAREKYKPFGKLGKLTKPEQVMQHQLAGISKHEWLFHQQYAGGSEIQCRICGRIQRLNKKGRPINR